MIELQEAQTTPKFYVKFYGPQLIFQEKMPEDLPEDSPQVLDRKQS